MDQLLNFVHQYAPQIVQSILMGLGCLVVAGYAYIKATPTQDDDQWLQKLEEKPVIGILLKALVAFSPKPRKEDPVETQKEAEKKDA